MKLADDQSWARLRDAAHGVLATMHARRGVDAVPVVFAVVAGAIVIPVDSVKAKRSLRLQRVANIEADGRCVLLVDGFDDDWSQLWWVRVHGTAIVRAPNGDELGALAARYPQYRELGTIVDAIVLRPSEITGWAAGE